ncbi:hypothetical protein H0H92_009069 [Tricholoma furcatifolium]|nr:hypothetical protein H0H92_009069 [Tricholoma furcatifolium]
MASSSHRPLPFEFPRVPLSPPDTNVNIEPTGLRTHPVTQESQFYETEASPAHSAPTPASAGVRARKGPSIAYSSSGPKESRERIPQRSPKAFIIVIPPMTLIQEHGQLGHTLASGPRHRLRNGLLMPLFPTMYGQLTAIAREFNFPSTIGLCLYPHFVDNGMTMTPRISDEYWPFLWAHVFETSPGGRPPINGNIEFDIDMVQARWYPSWLASSHRDTANYSSMPAAVSLTHDRGESKTTIPADEETPEVHSFAGNARHVPRKLSLVDRYDMMSARSGLRSISRPALSPPEQLYTSSRVLSPIYQDEEPKSARQELDNRVNSWRASAVLKPTSLAATGQTSLEPANMPNSLAIDDSLLETPDEQLNLADFAWSVTSAGPSDYDTLSPVSWDRVPSVDIGNRMEGSVCLTPSDCTSFGPSDYTLPSSVSSIYRLPSPDIAYRMLEDAPPTPLTATSWGAPSDFPPSPRYFSRPPSLDLGARGGFSRPVTPTTATSWGPASWPSSPFEAEFSVRSVHLGDRGDFSRPVTPSTATSWGAPLSYPPSPVTPFYASTPDAGHRGFDDSEEVPQTLSSSPNTTHALQATIRVPSHTPSSYPRLVIYQSVYPHFDLYPAVVLSTWTDDSPKYPEHNLYPLIEKRQTQASFITVKLASHYPTFDLYPEPRQLSVNQVFGTELVQKVEESHCSELHPRRRSNTGKDKLPAYPHFDLYPPITRAHEQQAGESSTSASAPSYPFLSVYPDVYPHFNLYPAPAGEAKSLHENYHSLVDYLDLNLYPPPVTATLESKEYSVRARATGQDSYCKMESSLKSEYSCPDLYSTLPSGEPLSWKSMHIQLPTCYPWFNIYPSLYPFLEIYPPLSPVMPSAPSVIDDHEIPYSITCGYPTFTLYPAVYPHFDLYPAIAVDMVATEGKDDFITTKLQSYYPTFELYTAVYPYFDIYPRVDSLQLEQVSKPRIKPYRLTHEELHAIVMMERFRSTDSFERQDINALHTSLGLPIHGDYDASSDDELSDMASHSTKPSELVQQQISTLQPTSARLTLPKSPRPLQRLLPSQASDVQPLRRRDSMVSHSIRVYHSCT